MYKVLKEKGHFVNVTIENTETKANINIGRASMEILNILDKAGYKVGEDGINFMDEWNIVVNKETAEDLSKLAMKMKKPIRDQRKKTTKKEENKKIDAMDVLLGLAQYN